MATALNADMTITTGEKSQLILSLESNHRDAAVLILEALSRSYVKANADQGITAAAAADLHPIRDDRPDRAGLYFATNVLLIAVIVLVIGRLQRREA